MPGSLSLRCPDCGSALTAKPTRKRVTCPDCGATATVPRPKRSFCFSACCMGGVIAALLAGLVGYAAYRWAIPRMQDITCVGQWRTLHATAVADVEALRADPLLKQLKTLKVSEGNLTSTTQAMLDLARACRNTRDMVAAVDARLQQTEVPPGLWDLHAALLAYYAALTDPLRQIDAQTDYMAPLLVAWQSTQTAVSDARSLAGGSDPDKSATSLDRMRRQLREAHDSLAGKSPPPGCADVQKVIIASLETGSELLGDVAAAIRQRDVRRMSVLAEQAEAKRRAAYQRMQEAVSAWGAKLGDQFTALFATLTEPERQVNELTLATNQRLRLRSPQALPLVGQHP